MGGTIAWHPDHFLAHAKQGPAVAGALRELLSNPAHAAAARSFSRRYPAFSIAEQRRRMVARIEQLAREGPILAASPPQGIPQ